MFSQGCGEMNNPQMPQIGADVFDVLRRFFCFEALIVELKS
jgi:hypothetical protein